MSEYNIKISKLENGFYKLKINNYSRYEVEEVEALAIKYLQKQIKQKENIIKEVRKEVKILESNCDISNYHAQKLYQILDKEGVN